MIASNHRDAIQAGDITRTLEDWSRSDWVNLYLGSGRCGASFNRFGVMNEQHTQGESYGVTTLMHADHWHHGSLGIDFHLPLCRILFSRELPQPTEYRQRLALPEGTLVTEYAEEECAYTLRCSFHPEAPDLLALEFSEIRGNMPDLVIAPEVDVRTSYGELLRSNARRTALGLEVVAGTADSLVAARVFRSKREDETGPEIRVPLRGRGPKVGVILALGSGRREDELRDGYARFASMSEFFDDAAQAWSKRWGSHFVLTDDRELQSHWSRSIFWILSSFGPDRRCPAPAMGWSGNGWQFNFPQDLSYVSPALLRLGHTDVVKSWVEFYSECIDFTREFTQRIYNASGTLWAWEHPIGCVGKLLEGVPPGTPNWFQHEIHNAAYPAQMAYEVAQLLGDPHWSEHVAWPVLRGSARFFASVAVEEANGSFSIDVRPSMGQNEFDEPNRRNYLCSLFAAASTLERAVRTARSLGIDDREIEQWQRILAQGLAFARLLDHTHGAYATSESETTHLKPGTQKHPIQLDPLFSLPLSERWWDETGAATRRAYEIQEELCRGGNQYDGWTLPSLALCSARLGEGEQAIARLKQLRSAELTDSQGVQLYESTRSIFDDQTSRSKCYYTTNAGLIASTIHSLAYDDFATYTSHEQPLSVAREWDINLVRGI